MVLGYRYWGHSYISFSDMQEDGEPDPQDSRATQDKFHNDKAFSCKDFIVVDDRARITLLKSSLF